MRIALKKGHGTAGVFRQMNPAFSQPRLLTADSLRSLLIYGRNVGQLDRLYVFDLQTKALAIEGKARRHHLDLTRAVWPKKSIADDQNICGGIFSVSSAGELFTLTLAGASAHFDGGPRRTDEVVAANRAKTITHVRGLLNRVGAVIVGQLFDEASMGLSIKLIR